MTINKEHKIMKINFKNVLRTATAAAVSAVLLSSAVACGSKDSDKKSESTATTSSTAAEKKLNVVASVNQWGSLAKELGGDKVDVTSIINTTSVDAHESEPLAGDIAKIGKADIVIINGQKYDTWAEKADRASDAILVDVSEARKESKETNEAEDAISSNPHLWFSAKARNAAAEAITEAYKKKNNASSSYFEDQNKSWKEREEKLENNFKEISEKTSGVKYAATEGVAGYLAADLKLENVTPQEYLNAAQNESEPSPAALEDFVKIASDGTIKVLIYNPQEADDITDQITDAAKKADVSIVEVTEQIPSEYSTLIEYMTKLAGQISDSVK